MVDIGQALQALGASLAAAGDAQLGAQLLENMRQDRDRKKKEEALGAASTALAKQLGISDDEARASIETGTAGILAQLSIQGAGKAREEELAAYRNMGRRGDALPDSASPMLMNAYYEGNAQRNDAILGYQNEQSKSLSGYLQHLPQATDPEHITGLLKAFTASTDQQKSSYESQFGSGLLSGSPDYTTIAAMSAESRINDLALGELSTLYASADALTSEQQKQAQQLQDDLSGSSRHRAEAENAYDTRRQDAQAIQAEVLGMSDTDIALLSLAEQREWAYLKANADKGDPTDPAWVERMIAGRAKLGNLKPALARLSSEREARTEWDTIRIANAPMNDFGPLFSSALNSSKSKDEFYSNLAGLAASQEGRAELHDAFNADAEQTRFVAYQLPEGNPIRSLVNRLDLNKERATPDPVEVNQNIAQRVAQEHRADAGSVIEQFSAQLPQDMTGVTGIAFQSMWIVATQPVGYAAANAQRASIQHQRDIIVDDIGRLQSSLLWASPTARAGIEAEISGKQAQIAELGKLTTDPTAEMIPTETVMSSALLAALDLGSASEVIAGQFTTAQQQATFEKDYEQTLADMDIASRLRIIERDTLQYYSEQKLNPAQITAANAVFEQAHLFANGVLRSGKFDRQAVEILARGSKWLGKSGGLTDDEAVYAFAYQSFVDSMIRRDGLGVTPKITRVGEKQPIIPSGSLAVQELAEAAAQRGKSERARIAYESGRKPGGMRGRF